MMISRSPLTEFSLTLEGGPKAAESRRKEPGQHRRIKYQCQELRDRQLTERQTLGVDRYVFFRADADTDYYRSSRPITDILNRYTCLV